MLFTLQHPLLLNCFSLVSEGDHEKVSKKEILLGRRKDKKDKKDKGYAALDGESSPEEDLDTKWVFLFVCKCKFVISSKFMMLCFHFVQEVRQSRRRNRKLLNSPQKVKKNGKSLERKLKWGKKI